MTEERCKELMQQVGYPDSSTIQQLIYQVANETEQRVRASESKGPAKSQQQLQCEIAEDICEVSTVLGNLQKKMSKIQHLVSQLSHV